MKWNNFTPLCVKSKAANLLPDYANGATPVGIMLQNLYIWGRFLYRPHGDNIIYMKGY